MLKENIKQVRKSKGLSQEELAIKLNVVRQTVSKWETNQSLPDSDKIVPLCELFDISTVFAIINLTDVEIKNMINIIEGIRYKIDRNEIQKKIII